jgi:hypothetical protein
MKAAEPASAGAIEAPPVVHDVLRSPGQPLNAATRGFMEPRFGHDFSRVRVHTDAEAAQSARHLHASAYTVGDHIVFAEGRLAPSTAAGKRLLAHELAHVIQRGERNAILRREPDPKGPHTQPGEARLRVRIVDTLEATKRSAIDVMGRALQRGDRAYLSNLGLSNRQIDILLRRSKGFEMEFGIAAERAVEQAVRADPFLSQYVIRGPQGRVPSGVGKPDWIIETPSSSMRVDLMTPEQINQKLGMWRRQSLQGKPKWYIEKGLNITYERLPTPPVVPPIATPQVAQGAKSSVFRATASGFRNVGRLLVREAPGLVLQAALMLIFPPGVNIHNDNIGELSRPKFDPAVEDALKMQAPMYDKLLGDDPSQSIYANVTASLDYRLALNYSGDIVELYLEDVAFLHMKITNKNVTLSDPKFVQEGSKRWTKQVTYSFLLYEGQTTLEEWVRRYGTGSMPPAAGVEAAQRNPEEGS